MSELISIIVPVYNVAPYIADCVDSILSQSYRDIELILVDDGSTDYSGTICDKYAQQDSRVRVFHLKNGGVSAARNFGMKQAVGEYFMFVDSDDELMPGALNEITQCLVCDADVIIFGIKVVSRDGEKLMIPESGIYDQKAFGNVYIELYKSFIINSPVNKVFRKSLVGADVSFPLHMSLGEDLIFCNAYLRCCKKIVTIEKVLYLYKQREAESLTTKYHDNLFAIYQEHYWDIVDTMKQFNPLWDRKYCRDLYLMYAWYIKQTINEVWHPQNKKNTFQKYREIRTICKSDFTKECVAYIKPKTMYDVLLKYRSAMLFCIYTFASKVRAKIGV